MHKGMLWFEHVERMEDEILTKTIYNSKACERSRRRPRLVYRCLMVRLKVRPQIDECRRSERDITKTWQIKRVLSDGKIKSTRQRDSASSCKCYHYAKIHWTDECAII